MKIGRFMDVPVDTWRDALEVEIYEGAPNLSQVIALCEIVKSMH